MNNFFEFAIEIGAKTLFLVNENHHKNEAETYNLE